MGVLHDLAAKVKDTFIAGEAKAKALAEEVKLKENELKAAFTVAEHEFFTHTADLVHELEAKLAAAEDRVKAVEAKFESVANVFKALTAGAPAAPAAPAAPSAPAAPAAPAA